MIVDSFRYWVETMHVDGFRFDLASILARGPSGQVIPNPPVLWDIESDPVLAGVKLIAEAHITWHGVKLRQPDRSHSSHSVAFTARFTKERVFVHVILNAYWEPLEFELPAAANGARDPWRRCIDTFLDSPHDIVDWERAPSVPGHSYRAEPRSVVVLFAGLEPERQSPGDG
jgi:pullulanase/glycogen debranching enzyme